MLDLFKTIKGQYVKLSRLVDAGTDTAQAQVVVPVIGPVVVPVRGAQVVGRVLERAAADHPPPGRFRSRGLIVPFPGA